MRDRIPYTNEDDPDYIDLHTYSELDSLFELYGHIRASNPLAEVERRIVRNLDSRAYQGHLVVLGGIDWNRLTRIILERLHLPIRQVADWSVDGGQYFEGDINGATSQYRPELRKAGGDKIFLDEDVALFARAVNPFNPARTVTVCNGMYGRGTYGEPRSLRIPNFEIATRSTCARGLGAAILLHVVSRASHRRKDLDSRLDHRRSHAI